MKKKKIVRKSKISKPKKGESLDDVFQKFLEKALAPRESKGCRGRRLKILPEKSQILGQDLLIQKGLVVSAGPQAVCKVGDHIIFSTDGYDKVEIGEESFYYILDTDQFIYEVL